MKNKTLLALVAAAIMSASSAVVFAQTPAADANKTRQRFANLRIWPENAYAWYSLSGVY